MSKTEKQTEPVLIVLTAKGGRLDKYLVSKYPDLSRSYLQRLINHRAITVDGHPVSPHHSLKAGQSIRIEWPEENPLGGVEPGAPLPFPVLYEDAELMVIDKPAGLLCHPTGWKRSGATLTEILLPRVDHNTWPEKIRPGLIHRLDRDTSGVLVFAKNPQAHAKISKQFSNRQVKKVYIALVTGVLEAKEGTFECAIGRHPEKRQQFAVTADGRWAVTNFKTVDTFARLASLVELRPQTGRTHQLRVQLSAYRHPILGDHVYGGNNPQFEFIKRQMLHASRLEFIHPATQKRVEFEAPPPNDFQDAVKLIRSMA